MQNGNRIGTGRIDTIDFWRGLVLIIIFINHVPGNIFETITPRNFGFSDSAEAFVFIAGLSVALAWGKRIARHDLRSVINKAWRRTFLLYTIHILLTFTAITLFAIAFVVSSKEIFLLGHGRDVIFDAPVAALLGVLSLGHQLGYYNILPLYILLVFLAPFLLMSAWRWPLITLSVSFIVYAIAQAPQVNLPSWPVTGLWFLNPFAWQFVFVIGMVIGVMMRRSNVKLPTSPLLVFSAMAFIGIAALIVTNAFGFRPGLFDTVRALGGFDKTDMSVMRLTHFIALAFLLVHFRIGERILAGRFGQFMALMGRHGLGVFALGSVLSSMGQIVSTVTEGTRLSGTTLTGLIVVPAGIMCLYWFARFVERPTDTNPAEVQTHPTTAAA
ncbi:OpgC family protein [Pseudochelatococcus sp. G4_1912]|uniref:OpgC family protein n=1 Tax=Pseudochelatococcus sp. G4_1912 TaxID=3114288 RepID=UPI0039C668BA